MHDRWPPEPPRDQPRNEPRAGNPLVVLLLTLLVVTILFGALGWMITAR